MDASVPRALLELPDLERAESLARYMEENKLLQRELADQLGIGQPMVAFYLSPLKLCQEVKALMDPSLPPDDRLGITNANFLSRLPHEAQRILIIGMPRRVAERKQFAWLKKKRNSAIQQTSRQQPEIWLNAGLSAFLDAAGEYVRQNKRHLETVSGPDQKLQEKVRTALALLVEIEWSLPPCLEDAKLRCFVWQDRTITFWDERVQRFTTNVVTRSQFIELWRMGKLRHQMKGLPKPDYLPTLEEVLSGR